MEASSPSQCRRRGVAVTSPPPLPVVLVTTAPVARAVAVDSVFAAESVVVAANSAVSAAAAVLL